MATICGIAGFVVADKDYGIINTERLTFSLAMHMRTRGTDATGICTVSPKGRVEVRKAPTAADLFLAGRKGIGQSAQTALIHTRHATQGPPSNPLNNHPIVYEGIIGIHNGMVRNDDDLFEIKGWDRKAQVDSEAIFAAIHHYPNLVEGLESIDASWAIAWIDQTLNPRTLWLARGTSSPLHYVLTKNGSIVFASTSEAVQNAAFVSGITPGKGKQPADIETTEAPPGFLACVDADGEMEIFPKFDGYGLKAVEKPGKHRRYTGYGSSLDDWESNSWKTGDLGKGTSSRSTFDGAKAYKEGDTRSMHLVGQGFLQHVLKDGIWVLQSVREVVEKATSKAPQIGDTIALDVRITGTADELTLIGHVMGVIDDGDIYVDWSATKVPQKAPFRITGSLSQIGG